MRQNNKAVAATGTLRSKSIGARQLVVLTIAAVAIVWAGIAFAQEAYVSHKLSQQAADLRQQNAQLAAQNAAYKKDVQTITSGDAAEEDARLNGYAKPNERTFLVAPPTPSASPSPTARPSAKPSPPASPGAH
jgi:cell division protein FtsB